MEVNLHTTFFFYRLKFIFNTNVRVIECLIPVIRLFKDREKNNGNVPFCKEQQFKTLLKVLVVKSSSFVIVLERFSSDLEKMCHLSMNLKKLTRDK